MSSAIAPTPIQIHIPQSLAHLTVPLSTYFQKNSSFTNLAVGACIFARPADRHSSPCQSRLLLIQRAATERGFPNLWEVPGGAAEDGDPSILHSVAREVFEETGFRLTRFVRAVGDGIQFTTGRHNTWMKLTFEIEVQERLWDAMEGTAGGQWIPSAASTFAQA